jgi:1,4-alpha-glucan branching enzyme
MLYLDYNRKNGTWIPNKYGGNENLEAVDFFQTLNTVMFSHYPNNMMIAEESTAWANVTKPVNVGGLGFNFKWNMGWMNDILRYMSTDPLYRKGVHECVTFSMYYAFSENYILPFSHDEVVHGKKSMLDKMAGSYEQKFASLRTLYAFMMAHPGKKLLFMGDEFGQFIEWNYENQLDWLLLDYEKHKQLQEYTKDLINFYKQTKTLWENDSDWTGFEWINSSDKWKNTISFLRISKNKRKKIVIISNFAASIHKNHTIGVPSAGNYEIIFSSNDAQYGGSGGEKQIYTAIKQECDKRDYRIQLDVPPLTTLFIQKILL